MDLPVNRFKEMMQRGGPRCGLWLGIPDATAAEIVAAAGFDWVLIDHEHAPFEISDVLQHLRTLAAYDVAPVVRPVSDDPVLLKKLLDIGVQTFLVPMVETARQAREVVAELHYPPKGRRGLGLSLARAARWNAVPNYLHRSSEEICLLVQVETVRGLENLEDILKVDGVDGILVGPADLSASMGHVGNAGHPDVVAAISEILRATRQAGRHAGVLCMDRELRSRYIDAGADFIGVGVDTLLMRRGAEQLVAEFRNDPKSAPPPQGAGY
jgi:4-hydroxy-2-oxoheptanedioate aldolase